MIYVSCGHEKGIGLEVFFKSYLCLPLYIQKEFTLVADKEVLKKYFSDYQMSFEFTHNIIKVQNSVINFSCPKSRDTPSNSSLIHILEVIKPTDILLTLPTSKDQLFCRNKALKGHTELFREYYKNPNLIMVFHNDQETIGLLTDHIPLKQVPLLSPDTIIEKVRTSLNECSSKLSLNIERVYFSGINPHAGESGSLGEEEKQIINASKQLQIEFDHIDFYGPFPGDTLHLYNNTNCLKFYSAHDQGLSYYKGKYQFFGINITLGLPFLRMSVDHGTAFELYGKNQADYQGCYYSMLKAYHFHKQAETSS